MIGLAEALNISLPELVLVLISASAMSVGGFLYWIGLQEDKQSRKGEDQ